MSEAQRAIAERVRDLFADLDITDSDFAAAHGTISAKRAQAKLRGAAPLSSLDLALAAQLCIDRGRRVTVDFLVHGPFPDGATSFGDYAVTGVWCGACNAPIAHFTPASDPVCDLRCRRCGIEEREPDLDWGD